MHNHILVKRMSEIREVKTDGKILDVRRIMGNFNPNKKWWIAKILGTDEKFGYNREFLKKIHIREVGTKKSFKIKEGVEIVNLNEGDLIEIKVERYGNSLGVKTVKGYFRILEIKENKIIFEDLTKEEFDNYLANSKLIYARKCPMSHTKRFVSVHETCFSCNYWLGCKNNKLVQIRVYKKLRS